VVLFREKGAKAVGCNERQRGIPRASGHPPRRGRSAIIHHPLSFLNSPGFTLIELLVVIAVIAVLMAILLPALGRVRKQARSLVCRAHLKQWGMVFALYTEEHEGRFPREGADAVNCSLSLLRGLYVGSKTDPNAPGRYHSVRTEEIACCPTASRGNGLATFTSRANGEVWMEGIEGLTFAPWEITKPEPSFRMSYGLNSRTVTRIEGPRVYITTPSVDVFALRGRDMIPLLFDAVTSGNTFVSEKQPPPNHEPSGSAGEICINRHSGTLNSLFFDWSARSVGLKELWTLKWHLQWNTAGPWTKAGNVQPEDWPKWMRGFKEY
jgi:prepilin-type N-terminal cleavage/methylation domain-containing protein/prepilin-type processing-associated H-X9-DG protein